jgi:hypothetical protein
MRRKSEAPAANPVDPVVVTVSADDPARFPLSIPIVPPLRVQLSRGRRFKARPLSKPRVSPRRVSAPIITRAGQCVKRFTRAIRRYPTRQADSLRVRSSFAGR